MKITIAGVGAMGGRYALMLSRAGNDVDGIDGWADNVNAINEHGLQANFDGQQVVAKIKAYEQTKIDPSAVADLVILFPKSMQLDGMMQSLKPVITDHTKILCLMNGIGHEEIIEKYVTRDNIFIGNTMWTAGMEGPGKLKLFGSGSVALRNVEDGEAATAAAKKIVKLLSDAGLNAEYSDNILYTIYKKATVNGTMNGLCTILDCNMSEFGSTSTAEDMVVAIVKEFSAVAAKEGIDLNVPDTVDYIKTTWDPNTIGHHYPSMHQDLITNHRLTEIDYINGVIDRRGKKYGIPTPYCTFLTQLVHAKEQLLHAK